MGSLTEISLFTGAGGGVLASRLLGHRVVCYVERDAYCIKVIQARIADGTFDDAPIWDDARTFAGRPWRGRVDLISAGFPCQPFSVGGRQKAAADERNGWPDTIRIIREVRPRFVFLENVPGLLAKSHGYFGCVLGQLAAIGFDACWGVLAAADVGAPHLRKRLWVLAADSKYDQLHVAKWRLDQSEFVARRDGTIRRVANTDSLRSLQQEGNEERRWPRDSRSQVANADMSRQQKQGAVRGEASHPRLEPRGNRREWWSAESGICGVAHGVAHRSHRLRALGNGQVPKVAAMAFGELRRRLEREGT